jgi:hypothetical protein
MLQEACHLRLLYEPENSPATLSWHSKYAYEMPLNNQDCDFCGLEAEVDISAMPLWQPATDQIDTAGQPNVFITAA